jgi:hypothetical protein
MKRFMSRIDGKGCDLLTDTTRCKSFPNCALRKKCIHQKKARIE